MPLLLTKVIVQARSQDWIEMAWLSSMAQVWRRIVRSESEEVPLCGRAEPQDRQVRSPHVPLSVRFSPDEAKTNLRTNTGGQRRKGGSTYTAVTSSISVHAMTSPSCIWSLRRCGQLHRCSCTSENMKLVVTERLVQWRSSIMERYHNLGSCENEFWKPDNTPRMRS